MALEYPIHGGFGPPRKLSDVGVQGNADIFRRCHIEMTKMRSRLPFWTSLCMVDLMSIDWSCLIFLPVKVDDTHLRSFYIFFSSNLYFSGCKERLESFREREHDGDDFFYQIHSRSSRTLHKAHAVSPRQWSIFVRIYRLHMRIDKAEAEER